MYNKLTNRVRALKSTSGLLFPGLPRFSRPYDSVYCTERKPKNKKRGRPGNEGSSEGCVPSELDIGALSSLNVATLKRAPAPSCKVLRL